MQHQESIAETYGRAGTSAVMHLCPFPALHLEVLFVVKLVKLVVVKLVKLVVPLPACISVLFLLFILRL
jgi:hypothetical protein